MTKEIDARMKRLLEVLNAEGEEKKLWLEHENARRKLLYYLVSGTQDGSYKEGDIPCVSSEKVRDLALNAGFTELALVGCHWFGATDLVESKRWPQEPSEKFKITMYAPNRYGLEPGATYDGVSTSRHIASQYSPDQPLGQDPVREEILQAISQLEELKEKLRAKGKHWYSLQNWNYSFEGDVRFWLNPTDQKINDSGWYSLEELTAWLNDEPENPVLRSNREKEHAEQKNAPRKTYKEMYAEALVALHQKVQEQTEETRDATKQRQLYEIALLRCPFPELVAQYVHTLTHSTDEKIS
ncbi:hypothetical protein KBC79_02370 [Candidatus Woesebacteria bacterium]|nr:hypothetical protein [Candidatus Woesebacteria bacterium]